MKNIIILGFMLCSICGFSQGKMDYNWLIGVEQDPSPDYPINCMNLLSFKAGELDIERLSVSYPLYGTNTSISGNNGNLLFYSNGCDIKDRQHNIMPNGDGLNPGILHENNCPDGGYSAIGGIIILPTPNDTSKFYVFHQAFEVFNESPFIRINRLYYSKVDMTLNNALGDVTIKNQPILTSQIQVGIQAVKHGNSQDWWVMAISLYGNKYYKILLTEDGVTEIDSQSIGGVLSFNGGGQIAFSPDGTKFAKYDFMDQLMLFDFDRNTGLLSNYQQMEIDSHLLNFSGLAFSPNSKRLYLSTQTKLWQLDLEAPDISASKTLVGEYDGFVYEFFNLLFPVYFQRMQLGPDCKIYMTSHGPVAYMHVINDPDELGTACNFEQRGLPLPCSVNYSIPNFPHYRLGTGYPVCDSNIVYVSSGYVPPPVQAVRVWPNPASGRVTVSLLVPLPQTVAWHLHDQLGREVRLALLPAGQQEVEVQLAGVPPGLYFWQMEQEGQRVGSGKLIMH
ncbi:MAG: T9SS type A sorting domain-containing protein [Saprospiraceae bacterium]|nr:MAG: T9SS type A sorting domain-containing protein [Saprospiraceae bacterium]